jgi:hypothetical protein
MAGTSLLYAHISFVIAGLDPAIHPLARIVAKGGYAGQARDDGHLLSY